MGNQRLWTTNKLSIANKTGNNWSSFLKTPFSNQQYHPYLNLMHNLYDLNCLITWSWQIQNCIWNRFTSKIYRIKILLFRMIEEFLIACFLWIRISKIFSSELWGNCRLWRILMNCFHFDGIQQRFLPSNYAATFFFGKLLLNIESMSL